MASGRCTRSRARQVVQEMEKGFTFAGRLLAWCKLGLVSTPKPIVYTQQAGRASLNPLESSRFPMHLHWNFGAASPAADQRRLVNADWLIRLRWVAMVGQLATVVIVRFVLGVEIWLIPLLVLIGMTAVSNVAFSRWFAHAGRAPIPIPLLPGTAYWAA